MYPFVADARKKFQEVEKTFKTMEEAYQGILVYFGEDPKTPPEEFFSMVQKFIQLFQVLFLILNCSFFLWKKESNSFFFFFFFS